MGTRLGGEKMATVKSTVNLNRYYKEQLEFFVSQKQISSVTEGINSALESYVKAMQKAMYEAQMKEASKDREFMERTLSSQRDFDNLDSKDQLLGADEW